MKALYYLGDKTLELREVPEPIPAEHEYLVKIEACGICGSDFEGYLGKTNRRIAPMVMGHEAAGIVVKAPPGALYPVGTNVAVFPNFYCGTCDVCREGLTNNCVNGTFLGILTYDGCMTEYIVAPEKYLLPFGPALSHETAAMVEPLAVALDAVSKISDDEIQKAAYTVIVGGGTIGLMVLLMLKRRKAGYVIMSDTFDYRLDLARKMGADAVINPVKEDFVGAVRQITGGKMCSLAFEAVGFTATAQSSIDALRPGGTAVWVGNAQKIIEVDMQRIVTTELEIRGTHIYKLEEFKECLEILTSGEMDMSPLITDRYDLKDGAEAFRALEENSEGKKLKVMLRM
ncbi:MAG: alcohol dehydrogenase catalytic domain-containing protein [Peptococcaceae bacterium]|jgi:2-desacetyl-2-hydroxyethyl bacteriochlorophyllide A dehydrogenase|nr:alcohol dehydrogenase catalytic domain-containing protein [Peptococcaceae bacterium]